MEGILDLSAPHPSLAPEEQQRAARAFAAVVEACEPHQNQDGYKKVTLVRLTYEHIRSEASKADFLSFFFNHTQIPIDDPQTPSVPPTGYNAQLTAFAEVLMANFFLPLRAASNRTPRASPQGLPNFESVENLTGTPSRLASLRRDCLIRDRHRCVISRAFDEDEGDRRIKEAGIEEARDDEGIRFGDQQTSFDFLEVAHILPHSLMSVTTANPELAESQKTALAILNMFDRGVLHLINGEDIDRTRNAITLTQKFHSHFGRFRVYFELQSSETHTYRIDYLGADYMRPPILPIQRTLFLSDTRTIDPPSHRLLAIHAAIARILHMSAAGYYIDRILDDLDKPAVLSDGSTPLGHLAALRINGWWDGRIRLRA
ncbi:hypothetical protein DV735_g621, partial [Chaetothyriales sp. CBS 134920]